MGTNFYMMNGIHIGKRSAAGYYCWDCKKTLCKEGTKNVHQRPTWFEKCPICGQEKVNESLEESAMGKELGFSKGSLRKGVRSVSSFTWAIEFEDLKGKRKVKDEYGKVFSINEFNEILKDCPLQFLNLIGQDFS